MASAHSSSTLDSLWKEVYADKPETLFPAVAKATKRYPFSEGKKIGDSYVQPVIVTRSHGFTRGRGLQTLKAPIVHQTAKALLDPMPSYLREIIPYDVAARMCSDKASFVQHSKHLVEQLNSSIHYRNEVEFFYGKDSLGEADSSVNSSTTKTVVTLTAASFAPGIWAGSENAELKFYKVSDDTLISSSTNALFTVFAVDVDAYQITVTGTETGIDALDTALASGNCYIVFSDSSASARGDQENAGMKKILTNEGSLFNINAATYNLWKGNEFDAGSADLTMRKIMKAVAKAVGRGLAEEVDVWIPISVYENLNVDQAELIRHGSSMGKLEIGTDSISFKGSNGAAINILPHSIIKNGDAFVIPRKQVVRTGSTDVTFNIPGRSEGEIFLHKDEQNGYELRVWSEQGSMLVKPAFGVYISGIVAS